MSRCQPACAPHKTNDYERNNDGADYKALCSPRRWTLFELQEKWNSDEANNPKDNPEPLQNEREWQDDEIPYTRCYTYTEASDLLSFITH